RRNPAFGRVGQVGAALHDDGEILAGKDSESVRRTQHVKADARVRVVARGPRSMESMESVQILIDAMHRRAFGLDGPVVEENGFRAQLSDAVELMRHEDDRRAALRHRLDSAKRFLLE